MTNRAIVDPTRWVQTASTLTDVLYPASRVLSDGATGTGTIVHSQSPQFSGIIGIGGAPASTDVLYATLSANTITTITVENPNTGTSAHAAMQIKSDAALLFVDCHSSTRTLTRFGVTLGGWNELRAFSGSGLIVGTNGAVPLILGTNAQCREAFDGAAKTLTESSATGVVDISLANDTVVGGELRYTIEAADAGGERQARRGRVPFVAESKAGSIVVTIGTAVEDVAVSSGTLTVAVTKTIGTAKFTLELNAVSSLTQTTLRVSRSVVIDGGTAGVTFL